MNASCFSLVVSWNQCFISAIVPLFSCFLFWTCEALFCMLTLNWCQCQYSQGMSVEDIWYHDLVDDLNCLFVWCAVQAIIMCCEGPQVKRRLGQMINPKTLQQTASIYIASPFRSADTAYINRHLCLTSQWSIASSRGVQLEICMLSSLGWFSKNTPSFLHGHLSSTIIRHSFFVFFLSLNFSTSSPLFYEQSSSSWVKTL